MAPTRARGSAKPPEPPADPVDRLRAICLALPEVTERLSHGEPTWFVRDRKVVVSLDDHHHGADHLAFWCPAGPGVQAELVDQEPVRFFRPPYVGVKGWLGSASTSSPTGRRSTRSCATPTAWSPQEAGGPARRRRRSRPVLERRRPHGRDRGRAR
ncbi:MAG: MmcQ/YjbR family DNA-binding protein [Acidimicrobiales bacterium]